MPALLTSTSTRPNSSYTDSTSGSSSRQWPTWQPNALARLPRLRSPAATCSHASGLRLTMTTWAPALEYADAIARPSPRVAPVTRATRPDRSNKSRASASSGIGGCGRSAGVDKIVGSLFVRCGARQGIAPAPVVLQPLVSDPRVEQQVKVPEHLPHDQQWLLADDRRAPHLASQREGICSTALEQANDPPAALAVLRELAGHHGAGGADRRAMSWKDPLERHPRRPAEAAHVIDAGLRAPAVWGLIDLGVRRDLRQQVI